MVRPRKIMSNIVRHPERAISEKPIVLAVSIVSKTTPENNATPAIINGSLFAKILFPKIE